MTWIDRLTGPRASAFALLHRPGTAPDRVDVLTGDTIEVDRIADIPLPAEGGPGPGCAGGTGWHDVVAVLPYRQIQERGFESPDDAAPLLVMRVRDQSVRFLSELLADLPDDPIEFDGDGEFDSDDEQYATTVREVLREEIGRGAGANFVIKRSFCADISNWSTRTALSFYRRILGKDPGSHWTFIVHTGRRTFVGASPERHITLDGGVVTMNPISGTYRYPPAGPELDGVLGFLSDRKEAYELYMVLDEELKMMGRVCDLGARAVGPTLKQMARLAHTEYHIEGRSNLDVREILRETMFAPTVVGGPLESACRVVNRYEPEGRDYYAGVMALIGRDPAGRRAMDSAILIRTADIDATGHMRIGVGATLVRDSDPAAEAAETRAKAAGLLDALRGRPTAAKSGQSTMDIPLDEHPAVRRALADRNTPLADFWFDDPADRDRTVADLEGRRVLVIDAEDTFTAMARQVLAALGLEVDVRRFDEEYELAGHDLVVVGPGPGDPRDDDDPKIAHLRDVTKRLLASDVPFLSVCLGHQVLSTVLGLPLEPIPEPNQGTQRSIEFLGRRELVGFYNTFAASCPSDEIDCPVRTGTVEVFREGRSDEVHGLRGPGFASVQFHPESVLSRGGVRILRDTLRGVLADGSKTKPYHQGVARRVLPSIASKTTTHSRARS